MKECDDTRGFVPTYGVKLKLQSSCVSIPCKIKQIFKENKFLLIVLSILLAIITSTHLCLIPG